MDLIFLKESLLSKIMLGLVATKRRNILNSDKYNKYFPLVNSEDPFIKIDGEIVKDTVPAMMKIVADYASDTEKIAKILKGNTVFETCRNIFDFIYNHIQYVQDEEGVEQLRRPARLFWDKKGDCDCFAIFAGSVLYNLSIPFKFRITKYYNRTYYQHVYVVVHDKRRDIIIDPVLDIFNQEKKYTEKKDFEMSALNGMPIQLLNGVDKERNTYELLTETIVLSDFSDMNENTTKEDLWARFHSYFSKLREVAVRESEMIQKYGGINVSEYIKLLDHILEKWCCEDKEELIEYYYNEILRINGVQMNGLYGFFKKIGNFGKKVFEVGKDVVGGVNKFNPGMIAIRNAGMELVGKNLFGVATTMNNLWLQDDDAVKLGYDLGDFRKHKKGYKKVKEFIRLQGGKASHLEKKIRQGAKKKKLLKGLGDGGASASGAAAAWVGEIASLLKAAGLVLGVGARLVEALKEQGGVNSQEYKERLAKIERMIQEREAATAKQNQIIVMSATLALLSAGGIILYEAASNKGKRKVIRKTYSTKRKASKSTKKKNNLGMLELVDLS